MGTEHPLAQAERRQTPAPHDHEFLLLALRQPAGSRGLSGQMIIRLRIDSEVPFQGLFRTH